MRLFIALNVPETIREVLISYPPVDSDVVRSVAKNQYHVTLHFLGNHDFLAVDVALKTIRCASFEVRLQGLGKFDGRRKSTTLWAGIKPSEGLIELHEKIAGVLQSLEIKVETRKYTPHITLARCKNSCPGEKIEQFLQQEMIDTCFMAEEFCLYQSELHGDGPRYKMLNCYALDKCTPGKP